MCARQLLSVTNDRRQCCKRLNSKWNLVAVCCDGKCGNVTPLSEWGSDWLSHHHSSKRDVSLFRNLFVKFHVMEPASSVSNMHSPRVHVCMYAERKVPFAHLINIYLSCELVILEKCLSTCPWPACPLRRSALFKLSLWWMWNVYSFINVTNNMYVLIMPLERVNWILLALIPEILPDWPHTAGITWSDVWTSQPNQALCSSSRLIMSHSFESGVLEQRNI